MTRPIVSEDGAARPSANVSDRNRPDPIRQAQERLVRDLHDLTIPRLSGLSFRLAATSTLVDGAAAHRISNAVRDIDDLVHELRRLVLGGPDGDLEDGRLEQTVRRVIIDAGIRLGCTHHVAIHGDLSQLPPNVAHHLRAVLTEALSNTVTHSRATKLAVTVIIGDDQVALSVIDNGVGVPPGSVYGLGLGSMAARARELHGTFTFAPGAIRGAVLRWCVPVPPVSAGA